MEPQSPLPAGADEESTTRLLRIAAPRPAVPDDRAARVRSAVQLEWQAGARRRAFRRRAIAATALLATAAAVAIAFRLKTPAAAVPPPPGEPVATIERIEGQMRGTSRPGDAGTTMTQLSAGDRVRTGEWLETAAAARAALRLAGGTSVRLDAGTRARLLSSTIVELTGGGLYLDTGGGPGGVEVRTPLGTAHDIGTQFEVRLRDASLRIRVRDGVVELRRGESTIPARAGTELTVSAGEAKSTAVSAFGPDWEWAAGVAPAFDIEGRPLAAFLEHLSREHGWTLRYADAALASRASTIILHGSVEGLEPREALAVTLATSGMEHRFRDGELFVFKPAD